MKKTFFMCMVCILGFQSLTFTEESIPFDCTMPIILSPILLQIKKAGNKQNNKLLRNQNTTRIKFQISLISIKEFEQELFDRVIDISYENPVNHFIIYFKEGLPIKLEHADESGNMQVYRQIIQDNIQKLDCDNKYYLELSRQMALKGIKGECPFIDWKPGIYNADIRASFTSDGNRMEDMNGESIGEINFLECSCIYRFCFIQKKLFNSCKIIKKDGNVSVFIIRLWDNGNIEAVQSYNKKEKRNCFDLFFYEDMGLKMLTEYKNDKTRQVNIWSKLGVESIVLRFDEWQKLGMPKDYDEWKKVKNK